MYFYNDFMVIHVYYRKFKNTKRYKDEKLIYHPVINIVNIWHVYFFFFSQNSLLLIENKYVFQF